MRVSSTLRTGILTFSLIAAMSSMSAAFADGSDATAKQQQMPQQTAATGPYDGPDFVVPANDIYP
jgi:hypothetical protein